jgi:hypothetical protein
MSRNLLLAIITSFIATSQVQAGAHDGAGAGDARKRQFVELSGFEGQEQELGAAVAATIMEISPTKGANHDFSEPLREQRLGYAVSTAMRTINVDKPYMHEMNDALVKMTLNFIQFAKDNELMDEVIAKETSTQFPMLDRVRLLIEKTGNKELALQAITDRTACFYQLVEEAQRKPGSITFKSPYGTVLTASRRLGQHDLTEEEIHEIWTIPRIHGAAETLGVDIVVSEWNEDGIITISLTEEDRLALNQ